MKFLGVAAAAVFLLAPSLAHPLNTWGTDLSDMWWNPNESGWGMNVTHQREIVFATIYVYGADNRVRWYVAPSLASEGGLNSFSFSGQLFETSGPYFGGPFIASSVGARSVGSMSITFPTIDSASASYSVDGAQVFKTLERQTFRVADISGSYVGGVAATITGCAGSGSASGSSSISISHVGATAHMSAVGTRGVCTYDGAYTQTGHLGSLTGTFGCTGTAAPPVPPIAGTFSAFEIEAGFNGFVARYTASYSGCSETGRLGGVRK